MDSVVYRADAEKVGHNRIGGGGLAEGLRKYRGFVASGGRCSLGKEGADGAEDNLLEDQRCKF